MATDHVLIVFSGGVCPITYIDDINTAVCHNIDAAIQRQIIGLFLTLIIGVHLIRHCFQTFTNLCHIRCKQHQIVCIR